MAARRETKREVGELATSDATPTTIITIPMDADSIMLGTWYATARTPAGLVAIFEGGFKAVRVGSANVTFPVSGATPRPTHNLLEFREDGLGDGTNPDVNIVASGTNALIQVTGFAATSLTWLIEAVWRVN